MNVRDGTERFCLMSNLGLDAAFRFNSGKRIFTCSRDSNHLSSWGVSVTPLHLLSMILSAHGISTDRRRSRVEDRVPIRVFDMKLIRSDPYNRACTLVSTCWNAAAVFIRQTDHMPRASSRSPRYTGLPRH